MNVIPALCVLVLSIIGVYSQNQNSKADSNNYPSNYPYDDPYYRNNYYGNRARIIGYESDVRSNGYDFRFDTDDPITREEHGSWTGSGKFEPTGEELGVNRVNGYASYFLGDNTPFYITYEADDLGYRPRFTIGAPLLQGGPQGDRSRPVRSKS